MSKNRSDIPVNALVREILDTESKAREDDRELVYAVWRAYGFDYPKREFFRLPNADYITRVKRLALRSCLQKRQQKNKRSSSASWLKKWFTR